MSATKLRRRRDPKPDRRRALELLASCRDGCTEAIMLAHGFTVERGYCSSRTQFRSFGRRRGSLGGNMLVSLYICQLERPKWFVNVIRCYGYYGTSDPLLC